MQSSSPKSFDKSILCRSYIISLLSCYRKEHIILWDYIFVVSYAWEEKRIRNIMPWNCLIYKIVKKSALIQELTDEIDLIWLLNSYIHLLYLFLIIYDTDVTQADIKVVKYHNNNASGKNVKPRIICYNCPWTRKSHNVCVRSKKSITI